MTNGKLNKREIQVLTRAAEILSEYADEMGDDFYSRDDGSASADLYNDVVDARDLMELLVSIESD